MTPYQRGGGHIVLSADPVGFGVSVGVMLLCARYLMNHWADWNQNLHGDNKGA